MEILSPEKLTRENKLNQEKNVNKQIVERLNFLEKNDSEDDTGFYKARSKQVGEVISSQIKEIKGINFEKAINQYLGYDLVERLLSQMPEAQDLVKKIDGRNNEALKKIIKHSDKYEIKLLDKNAEHEKEIQETFASLAEPLKIQEEIVNALQELLVKDDEFGSEYIQRLNKETEKLDRIIDETNLIFIKKAQELLTILPLSEKYQQELEELEKTLVASSKEDAAEILEIDWEILPAGSGPYENFQSGSGNGYIPHKINQARVDFIKSLGPDKIYRSKQADEKRAYEVYEFDTCVVICSPWSNHAVYVVPKEDWQSMSKIGKDKVRENGGIRFKNIPGWEDRFKKFISGEVDLFSLRNNRGNNHRQNDDKERFSWGNDLEIIKKKIRDIFFEKIPDLKNAYDNQDFEKAKEILKGINVYRIGEMGVASAIIKFGAFRNLMMECFPEAGLTEEDFYINNKNYFWKGKSVEEKIQNVRTAVFKNFPDIKEAIKKGDLEQAKIGLDMITSDDLIAFGLRMIVASKTDDAIFNSRQKALVISFPEVYSIYEYGRENSKTKYKDLAELHAHWGNKLADALVDENPKISELIKAQEFEKAKFEIIKTVKENYGVLNFTKKHNLYSLFGVKGHKGGFTFWLRKAFPQIQWSEAQKYV